MNLFKLSWKYLSDRPLNTLLNVVLFSLGIAIIVSLLIFSSQSEDRIAKHIEGVDLVVGAKGSPLQIILCNLFHIDFPTGNIPLKEAEKLVGTRFVKNAIPMALGDSYRTYRIVGTTPGYFELYKLSLKDGEMWSGEMEAVIGYSVSKNLGLKTGDRFSSQHGLDAGGGTHDHSSFTISGVLKPVGSAQDNLILTSVPSIWEVHGDHGEEVKTDSMVTSKLLPGVDLPPDHQKEITSLLIQFRSPMAAIQLPRVINTQTNMQAASPAFETSRLYSLLGTGIKVARWLAYIIVFIAAVSIFIALYNAMRERTYDLAIMRSMGSSKMKLFVAIILEGLYISLLGSIFGFAMGHGIIELIVNSMDEANRVGLNGLSFYPAELYVFSGAVVIGIISSFIPAIRVLRLDISAILARG